MNDHDEDAMPTQYYKKIVKLVNDDQISDAARYLEEDFTRALQKMQREYDVCVAMVELGKTDGEPVEEVRSRPRIQLRMNKADQGDLIRRFAYEMAKEKGGRVVVSELTTRIQNAGHKLDSKSPGTTVGNVLFRSKNEEWERIDKGVFKYVGGTH